MPSQRDIVIEILRINGGTMVFSRLAQELYVKNSLGRRVEVKDLVRSLDREGELNWNEKTGVVQLRYPASSKYDLELVENTQEMSENIDLRVEPVSRNYKVTSSRKDVLERIVGAFSAADNEEAKKKFEEFKNDSQYSWDRIKLIRYWYQEEVVEVSEKR